MDFVTPAMPLLSLRRVSRRFGGVQAIADVSLDVLPGSITSVIGPNGAGKTTLFNLICRLYSCDSGTLRFRDEDLGRLQPHQLASAGIGRTFQNLALFRHATVVENILTGMHASLRTGVFGGTWFFGRTRREEIAARERAEEIIEFLEIEELRDHPVALLSYGAQKRVELGRAIATRPRLLLLDEMVSGMNQEETEDIARFVLDLREELGITVLMIEHDMDIVMDISDQIHVLNFGRLIASGPPAEVASHTAVIEAYLGTKELP